MNVFNEFQSIVESELEAMIDAGAIILVLIWILLLRGAIKYNGSKTPMPTCFWSPLYTLIWVSGVPPAASCSDL